MTADQVQGVLAFVFLVVAVATFLLQGKQWPTFISAVLFGMFFGGTMWGASLMRWLAGIGTNIIRGMS